MDICHLTKAELEPKEQKYQGRVVLRGDIVKDDSEAYAVCTEQGSSASHFMDVIARLPGCDGQAVDAESAYTEAKMEDAPDCSEFQNRNVQMFGSVFRDVDDPSHGQTLMVQWFLPNEICMYAHSQDCGGKDGSKKFCWNLDGSKYRIENVFIEDKDYSCQYMWMMSKWLE